MENRSLALEIKPTFNILKFTFAIVPVVAGLDKFTNLLTQWDHALPSGIAAILPFTPHVFMMIVGIIEIIAGFLVFIKPSAGGVVVASWLTLIALTLIGSGTLLDVAVRDLVMAVGALTMVRLSKLVPVN